MQAKGFLDFLSIFTNYFYIDKMQVEKRAKYCTGSSQLYIYIYGNEQKNETQTHYEVNK